MAGQELKPKLPLLQPHSTPLPFCSCHLEFLNILYSSEVTVANRTSNDICILPFQNQKLLDCSAPGLLICKPPQIPSLVPSWSQMKNKGISPPPGGTMEKEKARISQKIHQQNAPKRSFFEVCLCLNIYSPQLPEHNYEETKTVKN